MRISSSFSIKFWGCSVVGLLVGVWGFCWVFFVWGLVFFFWKCIQHLEWVKAVLNGCLLAVTAASVQSQTAMPEYFSIWNQVCFFPFVWGLCLGFVHWDIKRGFVSCFRISEAVEEHSRGFYGWGENWRVSETTGYFFHARNWTKENSKRYKLQIFLGDSPFLTLQC